MKPETRPVCMITGAASGIGAATALRFARAGYVVAIGNFDASTRESAETVAAACRDAGSDTLIFDADVGSDADCRAAVASVTRRFGRLDALVNCAGTTKVITHDAFDQLDANEFERVYRVNTIGLYQMTRAAAPLLRESATQSRSTSVINISSLAALNGTGSSLAYAASKGAVNTMTLSLARSLSPHVRVNAIAPGMVDDGLLLRALDASRYAAVIDRMTTNAPLKRVSLPGEIADIAWFLCTALSITGQVIAAENGLLLNNG
ncbi:MULTISPECIES: SDR family NAD(P)-dependent oxidoreductase [Paraburkholderia]|uniref:SDR family NAD(P)-dependent oxidoreductase n=1 Tax=Paraburkholderia TaxID=1822464 RepID=UPI001CC50D61|nr:MULTISPECIES: SDR family oxidoreductase [Paraburkholderia]